MSAVQEEFIRDTTAEVGREVGLQTIPPEPCCTPNCKNMSSANETGGFIKLCLACVTDVRFQLEEEFGVVQDSEVALGSARGASGHCGGIVGCNAIGLGGDGSLGNSGLGDCVDSGSVGDVGAVNVGNGTGILGVVGSGTLRDGTLGNDAGTLGGVGIGTIADSAGTLGAVGIGTLGDDGGGAGDGGDRTLGGAGSGTLGAGGALGSGFGTLSVGVGDTFGAVRIGSLGVVDDEVELTMMLDEVRGTLLAAHSSKDSTQEIRIPINQSFQFFKCVIDPVESNGRTTKLFTLMGSNIPKLYWYEVYGGVLSFNNRVFVGPCATSDNPKLIWVCALKTRCHKPRLDCLVVDTAECTCYVMQPKLKWATTLVVDPNISFDASLVRRSLVYCINLVIYQLTSRVCFVA